jgi:hypothetical protein
MCYTCFVIRERPPSRSGRDGDCLRPALAPMRSLVRASAFDCANSAFSAHIPYSNTFVFSLLQKSAHLTENNNDQVALSSHSCALFCRTSFVFSTLTKRVGGVCTLAITNLTHHLKYGRQLAETPRHQSLAARRFRARVQLRYSPATHRDISRRRLPLPLQ